MRTRQWAAGRPPQARVCLGTSSPGVPQSPHPSLLHGPHIQPPPHPPTQASTAEKMPGKSRPRAPTTSINKDSQGAGSESPAAWAGEGCGLRSGSAETGRGEKEQEEEKEEGREERGTPRRGGGAGPLTPRTRGPARPAQRRGGEGEEGAVPARLGSAAGPRSGSWHRRRRTWFTAAWPARARRAEDGGAPRTLARGRRGRAAGLPHPLRDPRRLLRARRHLKGIQALTPAPAADLRAAAPAGGGPAEGGLLGSRRPKPMERRALPPSERLTSELSSGGRERGNLGGGWEDENSLHSLK